MFGGVWRLVYTNIEVLNTLQATRLGGFFYEQAKIIVDKHKDRHYIKWTGRKEQQGQEDTTV